MITHAMIKELRERTGIGIGKCKQALEAAKGDMELAISNLRKAGMATAVKKEGRVAKEGKVGVIETADGIVVVEINSETDFVAKNEKFQDFLNNIMHEVMTHNPDSLENFLKQTYSKDKSLTIDEYRASVVQAIGENIQIRRFFLCSKKPEVVYGVYSHLDGKIVTVIEVEGDVAQEHVRDVAMHIAASHPLWVDEKEIPSDIITKEKEIAADQIKGKPENIINKILEGKLNAFYDTVCLLKQKFIKDDKITVGQYLKSKGAVKVTKFIRWAVGEKLD